MDKNPSLFVMPFLLIIAMGSEGIQTVIKYLKVAERYGVRLIHGVNLWLILIDDHWKYTPDIDLKYYTPQALYSSFIPAVLVDRESRMRLCKTGRLWMLDEDSINEPGVRSENLGTGNEQVWGCVLLRMNEMPVTRMVEQGIRVFEHQGRRLEEARQGAGPTPDGALPAVVVSSLPGGFGGGALPDMLRILKTCSARLRVPLKTYVKVLDIGRLYPANRDIAIANRNRGINWLRILSTGAYRDIEGPDGAFDGPLCDYLQICPNAGPHGELSSLALHEWMFAQHMFLKFNSPLSSRLREHVVDVEANRGVDETGAPRIGSAMGVFVISLDHDVYRRYCSKVMASRLVRAVLGYRAGDAIPQGAQAASELSYIESYAESQTIHCIAQASGSDPDMYQEALGSFADRFAGLSGFEALLAVDASYQTVVSEFIPQVLQPRARQRALSLVGNLRKRCAKEKAAYASDLFGPRHLRGFIEGLLNALDGSMRVNAEKSEALTLHADAIFQEIDACHRRLAEFSRMGSLSRALHHFSIRATVRRYKGLADRAIRLGVARMVRTMVQEEVFLPARQFLRERLAELTLLEGKLEALAEDCDRTAQATLRPKPSPERAPVGLELADNVSLRRFYAESATAKGGAAKLIEQLSATVIQKEKSLLALFDRPQEELTERLSAYAGELFEPEISSLNVLRVFQERYGKAVPGLIAQAVQDSRPWIPTVGEAGLLVPVVKLLGVPEDCQEKLLVETLMQVDHSQGDWEVVKTPAGYDALIFLTYRSRVSLTMLLSQQRAFGEAPDLQQRVKVSAEKLAAFIPEAKLTETDAQVVALYGQLSGILCHDGTDGWSLKVENGDSVPIGESPDSVHNFFRKHLRDTVRVYAALWQALRCDGKAVEERLRALEKSWPQDEHLRGLLSNDAVERGRQEVRLMLPFARAVDGTERAG